MSNVPQFGNWENNGNVPYTEYFEKARKGKGGVKSLETPMENTSNGGQRGQPRAMDERRSGDIPANNGDQPQRYATDPSMQSRDRTGTGDPQRRTPRASASAGSDRSMDNIPANSPLHGKATDRSGAASPYRSQGLGSSTPGRVKPRQHDEDMAHQQVKGTTVPKFGEWDEKDPSAGDNYTAVFGRLKNERHGTERPSEQNQSVPSRGGTGKAESSGCSCFPWFKS